MQQTNTSWMCFTMFRTSTTSTESLSLPTLPLVVPWSWTFPQAPKNHDGKRQHLIFVSTIFHVDDFFLMGDLVCLKTWGSIEGP